jgi:hypothetical protein
MSASAFRRAPYADIAGLADLPADALRSLWSRHVSTPPPRVSQSLLALALGHSLQKKQYGGMSPAAVRLLRSGDVPKPAVALMPGTRLVREWNGKAHIVTIDEQGRILWNDKVWRSLSEVARAITGTRWSGPAFFGLRPKVKPVAAVRPGAVVCS